MMSTVPDLSICIVNHRTPELTRQCLRSIAATGRDLALEVFVVNNTHDECLVEPLRFGSTQAELGFIQNDKPQGFSANQNLMMQRACGRYLMPLNSDTIVQAGALHELIRFMDAHPRCGVAGPRLIRGDGQLQPSCRNFPNALTHFLEASGAWQWLKGNAFIGRRYYLCSPHDQVQAVDWLTAACLIVRAECAHQAGYFRAELFPGLYGEDLEWCWRIRRHGWQVMFDPAATIVHLENQSPLDDRAMEMYSGFYRFCAHAYSKRKRQSIRIATVLALFPRWLLACDSARRNTYRRLMALPMS